MSESETWSILPHVHVGCGGGRLLSREEADGTVVVRCANCGEEREGGSDGRAVHISMCFCGVNTGLSRVKLRCIPNPAPSPECSDEIVAEEVPT
jgi:hypothetical protein